MKMITFGLDVDGLDVGYGEEDPMVTITKGEKFGESTMKIEGYGVGINPNSNDYDKWELIDSKDQSDPNYSIMNIRESSDISNFDATIRKALAARNKGYKIRYAN